MAKKPLILIVSKDEQSSENEKNLLKKKYRIELATDGKRGLQLARELNPDLIIMELLLPKMDGFQLINRLKKSPSTRDIKILVFSLFLAEDRVLSMGADAFLLMPVVKEIFQDRVDELLAGSEKLNEVQSRTSGDPI